MKDGKGEGRKEGMKEGRKRKKEGREVDGWKTNNN